MARTYIIALALATALFGGCDPADVYNITVEGDEADVYEGDTTTTTTAENNYGDTGEEPEMPTFEGVTSSGEIVELTDDLLVTGETWSAQVPEWYQIGNTLDISMRTGRGEAVITDIRIEITGITPSEEAATIATELGEWDGLSVTRYVGSQGWTVSYLSGPELHGSVTEWTSGGWRFWVNGYTGGTQLTDERDTLEPQVINDLSPSVFEVFYWGGQLFPKDTLIDVRVEVWYEIDGIEMMPKSVSRTVTVYETD